MGSFMRAGLGTKTTKVEVPLTITDEMDYELVATNESIEGREMKIKRHGVLLVTIQKNGSVKIHTRGFMKLGLRGKL